MSHKRRILLGDSESDEHVVVFHHGRMVDILCPHREKPEPAKDS
jgi:hypothetical protein